MGHRNNGRCFGIRIVFRILDIFVGKSLALSTVPIKFEDSHSSSCRVSFDNASMTRSGFVCVGGALPSIQIFIEIRSPMFSNVHVVFYSA